MVDTGASSVAMSTPKRDGSASNTWPDGADSVHGKRRRSHVPRELDNVRVGDITLNNVDGSVLEGPGLGSFALLGMSSKPQRR